MGTSAKFTWKEPKNCTSYDLRYRVKGTEKWTIKKNIDGNNVTIKNLKASKTYEYQMRSYSNKTVESNSYTISVSAGKTYTYQVRAVNGNNKGDWSASKTISA